MLRTIVAILAISPAVLCAQTASPAQPSSTPVLQSTVVRPAALAVVNPTDRVAVAPARVRVSTGVVPPQIVHTATLNTNHILAPASFGGDRNIVIGMTVDATGKPENLRVVKSADMFTDRGVLEAVSQYRFKPAMLDNAPVPVYVTLDYTIQ